MKYYFLVLGIIAVSQYFPGHKNNQRKENIVSFLGTLYMYTIQLSEK